MKIETSTRVHVTPKRYGIVHVTGPVGVSGEKIPIEIPGLFYCAAELREAADVLLQLANALDPAKVDADGWIEWHGGSCPVPPDARVDFKMRVDRLASYNTDQACTLQWSHCESEADIVKYRIVK